MRFHDKVVLVTGASSGIGAATALLFAKKGASVVTVGRNELKLKRVEETANSNGNKLFTLKADVSKKDDAGRIIKDTLTKFGKLDVLVNNAGILRTGGILNGKLFDSYDEVMNTNLHAAVYLTSLAAPHLIATKGNIVNVSSIAGKRLLAFDYCTYYITKAALDHFSRAAALELGPHGVRVNIVSPGPVETDILSNAGLKESIGSFAPQTLLNRVSTAEEIGKLITFLASDDAAGITGSDFVADNGMIIKE